MSVHVYHPQLGESLVVGDEAVDHMRRSGWMTMAEWQAMQEPPEEPPAAEAKPAAAAGKTAKTEGK
jgi:hypothetical protein